MALFRWRVDQTFYTSTSLFHQIIPDLKVNVFIVEPQGLDEVNAWLQKEEGNDFTTTDHHVNLTTPTRAHVVFQPTKAEQLAQSAKGIVGDFLVKYDVTHPITGGTIQVRYLKTSVRIVFGLPNFLNFSNCNTFLSSNS